MWLLDPGGTFTFRLAGDKSGTVFTLRQLTIGERQWVSQLGADVDARYVAILRLGIVAVDGVRDYAGKVMTVEFVDAEIRPGHRQRAVTAEFVQRIPAAWSDPMSLQIAQGPTAATDEGN